MDLNKLLKNLGIHNFMILALTTLAIYNIVLGQYWSAIPRIMLSVLIAAVLDFLVNYYKTKQIFLPKSAIISSTFIGSILAPDAPFFLIALASALAIGIKHIAQFEKSHVFNPAATGIFIATILGASQLWWTAQPLLLVLALGMIIAWKFRRFDSQPAFLATYFIISAIILFFAGDISKIILKITDPFVYFFVFFMLVEPRTSPISRNGRIIYGVVVAVLASAFLYSYPAQFVLSALLAGNIFVKAINKTIK